VIIGNLRENPYRRLLGGRMAFGAAVLLALAPARIQAAEPPAAQPPSPAVQAITSPAQIFRLSTDEKSVAHPLRVEGRVSYVDPRWRHLWLEQDGLGEYMLLSTNPPPLLQGQRVRIEGTIVPSKGLDAGAVAVSVLQADAPSQALDANGRMFDVAAFNNRVVGVDAYVDAERLLDDDHLRLGLVIDDQPAIAYVKPDDPRSLPAWRGKFVRITGLYQGRFDPTRTQVSIEIFTASQGTVNVVGSIDAYPRFGIPLTPINELYLAPPGREVRILGSVQADDPGSQLVVRDDTGQVVVHSVQQQRLQPGAVVDAVGRVAFSINQWALQSALFRVVPPGSEAGSSRGATPGVLTQVGDIRQLSVDEASKGLPVEISGTVTWSLPGNDFFFLQDLSGGIRVRFKPGRMETPLRYKYLAVDGVTCSGGFAPAVELRRFRDLGSMSPPPVREITFDQAISGEEDGQWVRMVGFYKATESEGDVRRIHAITPGGEFVAIVVSPVSFTATPGTLVRITGVCEVVTNEDGGITGIVLRTPSLPEIIVEHDAPADPYNMPLRSLRELRQLNTAREFMRIHVAGTVLYAETGRLVYVEEDGGTVLLLSHDTQPLSPGDRIESVGILGIEGVRAVLREATYRRLGPGQPPAAVAKANPSRLLVALDSHLVTMRGTLIDALREQDRTRLTLQSGTTIFEAVLNQPPSATESLSAGEGLEVTGIYRIEYDDSRQPRAFQLLLRSGRDIAVFQKARLWTLQRALAALAILGGLAVLGLAWITALRRRVKRQTEQIREQLERQMKLESELQHAARLESLGVLAGGIAHDFNNLLTIIMGNVSFAMLNAKAMEAVGKCLRDIQGGAARARDLTQQLLTFAKGGSPLRSTVSMTSIVQDMSEFILRGSSARCEFDFPPELWNASVDKDQTAQVVQNLVLNAVQAMPNGGIIRISLRNEVVGPGFRAGLSPGRYVRLAIADSGAGISPDILPRIFEPYFTTKRVGSGLGLATVYSIVRKHQGHIEVTSARGKGTTFTLWLPAADPSSAVEPAPESGAASPLEPGKTARVLLMDDEESIRRLGGSLLEHMGLDATLVADGAEAVRQFEDARGAGRPIDLLILDLTIPGAMGGKATIEAIRKVDPRVPAIVSSGYSNDPVLADFKRYGFQAMVPKPYDVTLLATTIRELLARRS